MPSQSHKRKVTRRKVSRRKPTLKSSRRARSSRRVRSSRHSRRGRSNRSGRQPPPSQKGGFWLTDFIFGRKKTRYDNVIPATKARNEFLTPFKEFEASSKDLLEAHKQKEEKLARLQDDLIKATANVQATAGNVEKYKEIQSSYRQAAKEIVDEYNRTVSANAAAAATANTNKRNNLQRPSQDELLAQIQNKNTQIRTLQQQIKDLQTLTKV